MKKVGIIGWRGLVGSVLLERMLAASDFKDIEAVFFTTSQVGQKAPDFGQPEKYLQDAYELSTLQEMDVVLTCQGGSYTNEMHGPLRNSGWQGFWIDAASSLRMAKESIIILDPVNKNVIDKALNDGVKDFIGGNCTVSLMLMALGGLFKEGLIEWVTSMTYQAASGAGARNMIELIKQMNHLGQSCATELGNPATNIIQFDKSITASLREDSFPRENFGAPLAASLLPWIDTRMENGQTREEWKAQVEANKILGTTEFIPIDGTCVRVGAMRSHSQAFTVKLKKNISMKVIEDLIANNHEDVFIVANNKEETISKLTPAHVSGTLSIPVGRLRKMTLGDEYLNAFSVGDQLLWGAAEPLRSMLKFIL